MNAQGADRQQACACFEVLLRNGKDNINDRDSDGKTLLHYVAANNDLKTATKVVNYPGIDLNIQDNNGVTALQEAIEHGTNGLVSLLMNFRTADGQRLSGSDVIESEELSNTIEHKYQVNIVGAMNALPEIDCISSNTDFQKLYSDSDKNGELICQR